MIQILITLLLIVAVVIPILKKFNPITVLFTVSVLAMIGYTFFTPEGVNVATSSGNKYTNIIEYMVASTQSSFGGNVLNGILIIAYIGFMDALKATDILGIAAASLLKKIKQKDLLIILVFITATILKIFMNSAFAVAGLLISVLYPVLLRLGCTRASIASAIILGGSVTWGPAEQGVS